MYRRFVKRFLDIVLSLAGLIADEVKVPILGTAASNELVTVDENGKLHPYSFRMCFIDSYLGTVVGNYA